MPTQYQVLPTSPHMFKWQYNSNIKAKVLGLNTFKNCFIRLQDNLGWKGSTEISSCKAGSGLGSHPAQSLIQWGLEPLKACRWQKHPGQPVPPLGCPQGKTAFSYVPCEPLCFDFCSTARTWLHLLENLLRDAVLPTAFSSVHMLAPYFLLKYWNIYFAIIKKLLLFYCKTDLEPSVHSQQSWTSIPHPLTKHSHIPHVSA